MGIDPKSITHLHWASYRIRKLDLKPNKDKCVFGATKLIFLGYKILGMRISPDPEKIKAIKDMPYPKSKQDLWRFLEMNDCIPK